jgi:hypothetical protein
MPTKDNYSKNYYLINKEKILKYQKEYYYKNSEPKKRREVKKDFEFKTNENGFIISFK